VFVCVFVESVCVCIWFFIFFFSFSLYVSSHTRTHLPIKGYGYKASVNKYIHPYGGGVCICNEGVRYDGGVSAGREWTDVHRAHCLGKKDGEKDDGVCRYDGSCVRELFILVFFFIFFL
jgi:hypothetical protein